MLFNSYIFIFLFLPLTLAGYYGLNLAGKYKASLFFLTGMSFWFCGYTNIFYLLVLAVSIFLNYGTAALITSPEKSALAKVPSVVRNFGKSGASLYF